MRSNFLQCYPILPENYALLENAAVQYIKDTEAFDRTVCTGPIIDGSIMPNSPREAAIISKHAQTIFRGICASHRESFSHVDLRKEIARQDRAGGYR